MQRFHGIVQGAEPVPCDQLQYSLLVGIVVDQGIIQCPYESQLFAVLTNVNTDYLGIHSALIWHKHFGLGFDVK